MPLLQAEHLALRAADLSRADRATFERHKSAFREELMHLAPLIDEGYWVPLKRRWNVWIDKAEPNRATPSEGRTADPIEYLEQRLSAKHVEAIFDTRRARAIIELIPDMTSSVDPLALDSEPLIPG